MSWRIGLLFVILGLCSGSAHAEEEEVTLECLSNSIVISFRDSYFTANEIDVTSAHQIHVNSNPQCHADQKEGGFILTLYQPFSGCGTPPEHDSDNYVYRNVIVFSEPRQPSDDGSLLTTKALLNFTCDYEDKYIVSSEFALTPDVRTLNFITAQGVLAVEMNLYQRSDFHPKSRLGNRPKIIVGVPIYVSVDMVDVFGEGNIAMTMQSCYATTSSDYVDAPTGNFHHLIIGRCASPDDGTVKIYSNGIGFRSRFSFQMFQWKDGVEYVYLHCEVQVCNKTEESCSGSGQLCSGLEEDEIDTSRRKRASPEVQGNTGFISLGPIAIAKLENGKASYDVVGTEKVPDVEVTEENQKTLLAYVFGSIAAVLVVVAIALVFLTVSKKKRKNEKIIKASPPPPYRPPSPQSCQHSPLSLHKERHLPVG